MALLAQPKRKEKYGFDPRNTNWASDDNKFGQKLMEKMGWEKGKGLGANEDGIVEHIKASYKSDTKGLGCSPRDADAWIAHQDDFNDLLRVLNEDSSREPEKVNSSNEDREEGRKRFYGRFARGRVQTLRSTDDLDCIMGRRKTSEPSTPVTQSANNSDDEEKDTDSKTVTSTFSVQEYFAKKMKELKSRRSASHGVDGEPKNLSPTSFKASAEGTNCTETRPVYSAVSFSYNDEKSSSTSTGVSKEKGYDVDEWAVTDKQDKNGQEKKKKKKGRASGTENTLESENGDSIQITKRKKKKLKAETVSCEEASVTESSSQLDSNNNNSENERELGSFLPNVEDSIERKKIKSKRKEYDARKSFEEDDCKEMNKRKKRKLKLENNLSDECQTSVGEISTPLQRKKKETTDNTEVGAPLNERGENSLKKKREKRKRKETEMNDTTSQHCDDQKVESSHRHSVSQETEGAKNEKSRKRRKGEDECVGEDCYLEETGKKLKKKKKK